MDKHLSQKVVKDWDSSSTSVVEFIEAANTLVAAEKVTRSRLAPQFIIFGVLPPLTVYCVPTRAPVRRR